MLSTKDERTRRQRSEGEAPSRSDLHFEITALIVGRESPSRIQLQQQLDRQPCVKVLGLCADGARAPALIERHAPELVVLDVLQSNGEASWRLNDLVSERLPVCIVVADEARYALQAFEAGVTDFLLYPFDTRRLQRALYRAREWILHYRLLEHGKELISLLQHAKPPRVRDQVDEFEHASGRLVLKNSSGFLYLDEREIDWIEADDVYVQVHAGNKSYLIRERLKNVEHLLDREHFVRIHRSTIVHVDRIREITPHPDEGAIVTLCDGTELKMSRSFRKTLGLDLTRA